MLSKYSMDDLKRSRATEGYNYIIAVIYVPERVILSISPHDVPLYKRPDRNLSRRLLKLSVNIWFALPSTGAELEGWVVEERKGKEKKIKPRVSAVRSSFTCVRHNLTVLAWRRKLSRFSLQVYTSLFLVVITSEPWTVTVKPISSLAFTLKVSKPLLIWILFRKIHTIALTETTGELWQGFLFYSENIRRKQCSPISKWICDSYESVLFSKSKPYSSTSAIRILNEWVFWTGSFKWNKPTYESSELLLY